MLTIYEQIKELEARLPEGWELNPGSDCSGFLGREDYLRALQEELRILDR